MGVESQAVEDQLAPQPALEVVRNELPVVVAAALNVELAVAQSACPVDHQQRAWAVVEDRNAFQLEEEGQSASPAVAPSELFGVVVAQCSAVVDLSVGSAEVVQDAEGEHLGDPSDLVAFPPSQLDVTSDLTEPVGQEGVPAVVVSG